MKTNDTLIADAIAAPLFLITGILFFIKVDVFIEEGLPSVVSPAMFPSFVIGIATFLSFVMCLLSVKAFLQKENVKAVAESSADALLVDGIEVGSPWSFILYILILYAYRYLMEYIGFLGATPFAMLAVASMLNGKRYAVLVPSFIAFAFVLDFITFRFIRILMPTGAFFQ